MSPHPGALDIVLMDQLLACPGDADRSAVLPAELNALDGFPFYSVEYELYRIEFTINPGIHEFSGYPTEAFDPFTIVVILTI